MLISTYETAWYHNPESTPWSFFTFSTSRVCKTLAVVSLGSLFCRKPEASGKASSQSCGKRLLASSCLSVCPSFHPSVRMEQLGSHWTDFHEICYLVYFENLWRKFKFRWSLTRIRATLREYHYTFFIISRILLLRMRNGSDRVVEKIKTHFLMLNFLSKTRVVMR